MKFLKKCFIFDAHRRLLTVSDDTVITHVCVMWKLSLFNFQKLAELPVVFPFQNLAFLGLSEELFRGKCFEGYIFFLLLSLFFFFGFRVSFDEWTKTKSGATRF